MDKFKFKSAQLITVRREPVFYCFKYTVLVDGKLYKLKADNIREELPN